MNTFRNRCDEDFSVVMPDGATKVFLSTKGALEDVSPNVMAFLNYVDGIIINNDFVQEIDQEIKMVKTIEKERRSQTKVSPRTAAFPCHPKACPSNRIHYELPQIQGSAKVPHPNMAALCR